MSRDAIDVLSSRIFMCLSSSGLQGFSRPTPSAKGRKQSLQSHLIEIFIPNSGSRGGGSVKQVRGRKKKEEADEAKTKTNKNTRRKKKKRFGLLLP